jgi:hypothetical protein
VCELNPFRTTANGPHIYAPDGTYLGNLPRSAAAPAAVALGRAAPPEIAAEGPPEGLLAGKIGDGHS